MKCFTVSGGNVMPGIPVADGHVEVGQAGRGRRLVRAPLPAGAMVRDGRLEEVPGEGCVILVRDHSGYRGTWHARAAYPAETWDIIVSRSKAHRPPDGTGALADGHTLSTSLTRQPCPTCDAIGTVPPEGRPSWKVLAEGRAAQGEAGGMGGGPEYLAVLKEEESVEIVREGRLYGAPTVVRVEARNGAAVVTLPRQEAASRLAMAAW